MQWKDKDGVIHDKGMITPTQFATDFIDVDWENYVCIVNDPRNPTMQLYTVDYLQNVIGGPPVIYLNLPSSDMKAITRKLLEDGNPVWMGCDVGKQFDRTNGLWDLNIFEYENLYNVKFGMNKANRLRFRQTLMTHAMLFTGVHVENDQPVKWRVENSWGETGGVKGFYTMNDNWYDEHMFEIACPKSYLTEEMLQVFSTQPTVLPAWDPMGSLAREEALLSDSSTSDLHVKL